MSYRVRLSCRVKKFSGLQIRHIDLKDVVGRDEKISRISLTSESNHKLLGHIIRVVPTVQNHLYLMNSLLV